MCGVFRFKVNFTDLYRELQALVLVLQPSRLLVQQHTCLKFFKFTCMMLSNLPKDRVWCDVVWCSACSVLVMRGMGSKARRPRHQKQHHSSQQQQQQWLQQQVRTQLLLLLQKVRGGL